MVTFKPESQVASCRTLGGAQKLAGFLTDKFTGSPDIREEITFRSVIETSGKVSVHASMAINETGHSLFKAAVGEFKHRFELAA